MDLDWLPNLVREETCPPAAERCLRALLGDPGTQPWSYENKRRNRTSLLVCGINDPAGLMRAARSVYACANQTHGASHVR
jgi:hypothetical protein